MKILIAIIATVITLVAAAPSNQFINLGNRPKVGIINGDIVKDRAIPYQVFIESADHNYNARICSGTLISQRYILTVARCVNGNMQLYVTMGTNRIDMPAFTTTALSLYGADIVIHEDYHFNGEVAINDIALVKLPCVLYLSDAIQIAKLPSRADIAKDYVGETARISGWGMTSPNQTDLSPFLMEANVQIVDDQTCKEAFPYLEDSTLCSNGISGTGACIGDFGDPLVLDGVQIGIISLINDNCEQPIAFTKITSYLDWIENNSESAPKHHSNKFQSSPKVGIINGQEAKTHSIPYQVAIQGMDENNYLKELCGGSLISQSYILTAASCVSEIVGLQVALGVTRTRLPEFSWIVMVMYGPEITIHENFHFNGDTAVNDIAVVKLPAIFDLTDAIQLVELPRRADINEDYVGQTARISGFGKTANNQSDNYATDNLMQADVQIISNEVCKETIPDFTDSNLCSAGVNGSMACNGDFGGPLVIDGVQIGIISYIVGGCLPGNPTVFTKITSYLDWIQNHTDVVIQ